MLHNNIRKAMAAAASGPTLTAQGWPTSFATEGLSNETYPALRINGAISPQSLSIQVTNLGVNDSYDAYMIWMDNGGATSSWYSFEQFNADTGHAFTNPCYLKVFMDYTGSGMLPVTLTVVVTHVETASVIGSFDFVYNPEPV